MDLLFPMILAWLLFSGIGFVFLALWKIEGHVKKINDSFKKLLKENQ